MRKKTVVMSVAGIVGVVLFATMVAHEGVEKSIDQIAEFGILPFLGFVAISMANFALYSLRWKMILDRQVNHESQTLSLWRLYWHRMTGFAFGYFTPLNQAGGEPVRVALLCADGVPSQSAVASATLDIAFELCSYVVFIGLGVAFALVAHQGTEQTLVIMAIGLVIAFSLLVGFFFALARGKSLARSLFSVFRIDRVKRLRAAVHWCEETEGVMRSFFRHGNGIVVVIALLSMAMVTFRVIETLYLAWGFHVSLTITEAFLISALPGIALLLPVPGGLGIFEGGFSAVFSALGVALSPIAFALVIRLRDGVFILFGTIHMIRAGASWGVKRK
jgi:uncharacterized protein (TIRG00374 family)